MWGEGRSLCLARRELPALLPCFAFISLCYWLAGTTHRPHHSRGLCSCEHWPGLGRCFGFNVCVTDLNLAGWDRGTPLRPQGGGSAPGRREGAQCWESGKVRFPTISGPAHNLACIRADGHIGVACQLFPFKLVTGDPIWVLFRRSAWGTSWGTRSSDNTSTIRSVALMKLLKVMSQFTLPKLGNFRKSLRNVSNSHF